MSRANKKLRFGLLEIFTLLLTLVVLIPLYFAVLISLKSPAEAAKLDFSWPEQWMFTNYTEVMKLSNFKRGLTNSVIFVTFALIGQLFLSSMTSFVLGRRRDRLSKIVYSYFIFGLLPGGFLIPTILVMDKLELYGTRLGFVALGIAGGSALLIFLITGFIRTVPREIDESAVLEGCGVVRLFFQIILFQLKPIMVTGAVLIFMATWNDFFGPLVYLPKAAHQTLPMMIYHFNSMYGTQWELLFSCLLIVAIPVLVFYLFAQKFLVEGMTAGAVKG